MRIFQILPTLTKGDGVGNEALQIDRILREAGWETRIYADVIGDTVDRALVSHIDALPELAEEDVVLCHLSIASPIHGLLRELKCHILFRYHNITPPEFFRGYDPVMEWKCREGLRQFRELIDVPEAVLADSGYNKAHLRELGYTCPIEVLPILIDLAEYDGEPDRAVVERMRDGVTNILFVGRVMPNKKQEDVIKAFSVYHRRYNPDSRLILAGRAQEVYLEELKAYQELLGLEERDVVYTGSISHAAILAYYRTADLFLCMSEHEGFCIPLLEAMHFGVPIAAYDSTVVGSTLGDGGVLLRNKDMYICAQIMDMILTEESLRERIRQAQKKVLAGYDYTSLKERLLEALRRPAASGRGGQNAEY